MKEYRYRADAPYPKPIELPVNPRYARILMSDYSGNVSELTAINQYIYHHLEFGRLNTGIAKCLRSIAMVEMHHLELLGECIIRLGVAPRYYSETANRLRYWNAGFVRYGRKPREMLEMDLRAERGSIRGYEQTMRRIEHPGIVRLIKRIIEDEKLHAGILEDLLSRVH
ncbi:MAG TPA: hypothetical protein DEQ02_04155 [Ruminococcaceae bacterium]|nr:hypothetical protein [Oscillospiraceae bacterium]